MTNLSLGLFVVGVSWVADVRAPAGPPSGKPALATAASPEYTARADPAISPPDLVATRLDNTAVLTDGLLTENAWASATPVRGVTRAFPIEGGKAFSDAEFRLFYDAEALYVGARVWQNPAIRSAHLSQRDQLGNDDFVAVLLKPLADSDVVYLLRVNPLGVQSDVLIVGPEVAYPTWDGVWDSAGALLPDGYSVEMRVPFATLRISGAEAQVWGLGVEVITGSAGQVDIWPPYSADRGLQISQLGRLHGIENISPGARMQVIPSLVGRGGSDAVGREGGRDSAPWVSMRQPGRIDPGLDLRYGVTPGLTASGTLNPDFSQIEADPDQLDYNLRYPLLLEEKRPFFLEGLNAYETPLPLLYTRSINDPVAGVKLAGTEGNTTLGVLSAWDQDPPPSRMRLDPARAVALSGFEDATGLDALTTVARVALSPSAASRVGLLVADKELMTRGGARFAQNTLGALDARLTLAQVYLLTMQAGGALTGLVGQTPLIGSFALASLRREDRSLLLEGQTAYYGADFRAETSSLARTGYVPCQARAVYKLEEPTPGIAYASPEVTAATALDDRTLGVLDWSLTPALTLQGTSNATFVVKYQRGREFYDGRQFLVSGGTAQLDAVVARWLELSLHGYYGTRINYDPQDLFLGRAVDASAVVRLMPTSRLRLEARYVKGLFWRGGDVREDVDLADAKLVLHFDTALSVRLISQLDTFRRSLRSSVLLSYVYRPGTAVYIGFQDSEPTSAGSSEPAERVLFMKLSFLAWL